eukprot:TRINITY_DN10798_c0_g1_i1.p1 TRINITY_DN10798_c0_g1~~TRINITY_DN10798_c0_g1_i1.p1  ORF type:complete len:695 (-),score=162.54 TRINITY_DN10798_c0_g1_i1:65-2149(-)
MSLTSVETVFAVSELSKAENIALLKSLADGLSFVTKEFLSQPYPPLDPAVPHAPRRPCPLDSEQMKTALRNALRYFPSELHGQLAKEFAHELKTFGHIYMMRLRPTAYAMKAYPIAMYPARCQQAAAVMLMIQNNLDPKVAQFPHELVTYGGNGCVFSNWAQYHLVMQYLSQMTTEQTLVMYSGHPMGLFPSHPNAPRVVITNGMVVPNYSSRDDYDRMFALGVTMYGQMTAGSYCYIGPQGIVHGTTLTVLGAARKYLGLDSVAGKVFVSSGLGGMSGAQGKAGVICGGISIIAEINEAAARKRLEQGWVHEILTDLDVLIARIKTARAEKKAVSIAYQGNVVDLWERLVAEPENLVDLGSDQTSLHNPYNGGYFPVGVSFDDANRLMATNPTEFKAAVQASLRRHVTAINQLCARGMRFWDYGNSFLLEASRAGADIFSADGRTFRYPSYVQDIMGDIFSLGFGPFRWVCTSGLASALVATDLMAASVIAKLMKDAPERTKQQYSDNYLWITQAQEHRLVVGSQARILYSDHKGRTALALAFNDAVRDGTLKAPVVISRDHHDVSGTDSPYRETSNITDGSMFCADMAVQNAIGDSFRGATWVALHNGGGTGWGEAINGGFGMVLDGSPEARARAAGMLLWDVNNGVSRRAWAENENAEFAIRQAMKDEPLLQVTLPNHADRDLVADALKDQ